MPRRKVCAASSRGRRNKVQPFTGPRLLFTVRSDCRLLAVGLHLLRRCVPPLRTRKALHTPATGHCCGGRSKLLYGRLAKRCPDYRKPSGDVGGNPSKAIRLLSDEGYERFAQLHNPNKIGHRVHSQFLRDTRPIAFHGTWAQIELTCDDLVGVPLAE